MSEDLVEYETDVPHIPYAQVPVQVCGPVVAIEAAPQHIAPYTLVVDTTTPVQQLLPLDVLRVRATIIVCDQPVVISTNKADAAAAANTAAGLPHPNGAYIPASANQSTTLLVSGVAELWVTSTWPQPARVSVIVERRSPA